jgi:phosphatidylglycerophosphate synthase
VLLTSTTAIRDRVDRQLATGAAGQLGLLAALAGEAHLGAPGWAVGAAYAVGLWALLAGAARRAGSTTLGPADRVTLARAVLVGGVAALAADRFAGGADSTATLALLAAVALVLDGVDGQVARRTGTVSALGARFDMEVDAFLALVLSLLVATSVSPWALAIGGMRYVYVAASWALPWLRGPLPTRRSAKVVAAAAGIVLVVAAGGVLAPPVATALVVVTLAAVSWSFGRSVAWLWRARAVTVPSRPRTEPSARASARCPQPSRTTPTRRTTPVPGRCGGPSWTS